MPTYDYKILVQVPRPMYPTEESIPVPPQPLTAVVQEIWNAYYQNETVYAWEDEETEVHYGDSLTQALKKAGQEGWYYEGGHGHYADAGSAWGPQRVILTKRLT
jgi:hypothetical protein